MRLASQFIARELPARAVSSSTSAKNNDALNTARPVTWTVGKMPRNGSMIRAAAVYTQSVKSAAGFAPTNCRKNARVRMTR